MGVKSLSGFAASLVVVCVLFGANAAYGQSSPLEQRLLVLEQQMDGLLKGGGSAQPSANASPDVAVRLDQLENQLRSLTGQVENLQFQLQQLQQGGVRQQGAVQPSQPTTPPVQQVPNTGFAQTQPQFQPSQPSQPSANDLTPLDLSSLGGLPGLGGQSQPQGFVPTSNPQEAFQLAQGYMQSRDYELAEAGFRQFVEAYPDNALVPDAKFMIGESQFARGQYRQAAESYLGIYENYRDSILVPESLYKLALSLEGLNAPQDACGALKEAMANQNASEALKAQAQTQMQKMQCS